MDNRPQNHGNDAWTLTRLSNEVFLSSVRRPNPQQPSPLRPPQNVTQRSEFLEHAADLSPFALSGGHSEEVDDGFLQGLLTFADCSENVLSTPIASAERRFDFASDSLLEDEKAGLESVTPRFSSFRTDSADEYWDDDKDFPAIFDADGSSVRNSSAETHRLDVSQERTNSSSCTDSKTAPDLGRLRLRDASSETTDGATVEAEVLEEMGDSPSSDHSSHVVGAAAPTSISQSFGQSRKRLQPVKKQQKTENTRTQHNQAEARRRERIKRAFSLLRVLTGCPLKDRRSIVAAAVFQLERYAEMDRAREARGLPPLVEQFDMRLVDARNTNILPQLIQAYENHLKNREQRGGAPQ